MFDAKAYIKQNPFFLAPMAGVTDQPFRSFMREMSCGIITSELVSARALQENSVRTRQLMEFSEDQRPYGIQIFGSDPYTIGEGAKKAEDFGADFIDLNLGCPVPKVVKRGAGAGLLKDLKALSKVLYSLKSSVKIPVSLKVRTGWDDSTRNADQVAHIAYEEGFSWMSVHGRTRSQAYSGKADWSYMKSLKAKVSIPVVGNGDLISGHMAFSAKEWSNCDAVMIGRGCLNDPWIFLSALDLLEKKRESSTHRNNSAEIISPFKQDFKKVIDRLTVHLENFYDGSKKLLQLKKFSAWFSSGFPQSTEFRKTIFQEKDEANLKQKIDHFFLKWREFEKPEPQYEPFLMRGHG